MKSRAKSESELEEPTQGIWGYHPPVSPGIHTVSTASMVTMVVTLRVTCKSKQGQRQFPRYHFVGSGSETLPHALALRTQQ